MLVFFFVAHWQISNYKAAEMENLDISIVIPVYNEEGNLRPLFDRLYPVMRGTGRPFEISFTDDGDLQNPPEEIPKLVAEVEKGHDVVGTIRQKRQDTLFRKAASRIVNITTNKMTGMRMS